jgi:hypothetical protein
MSNPRGSRGKNSRVFCCFHQALHIDRKGRGLIACCLFCVLGGCCIVGHLLAASELVLQGETGERIVLKVQGKKKPFRMKLLCVKEYERIVAADVVPIKTFWERGGFRLFQVDIFLVSRTREAVFAWHPW